MSAVASIIDRDSKVATTSTEAIGMALAWNDNTFLTRWGFHFFPESEKSFMVPKSTVLIWRDHLKSTKNPRVPSCGVLESKEKDKHVVSHHSDEEDEWEGLWSVGDVKASLAQADIDEKADAHQETNCWHRGKYWDPQILDPPVEWGTTSRNEPNR